MGLSSTYGIHETGELFSTRQELAKGLGLSDSGVQHYLYGKKYLWNGLTLYVIPADNTRCISCGAELTIENHPEYIKKQGWRKCKRCVYKRNVVAMKKQRKVNPFARKAVDLRHIYKGSITKEELECLWEQQNGKCSICKVAMIKSDCHVDHIIPYSLCKSTVIANLQFLCEQCNRGKFTWAQEEYINHCKRIAENN